MPPPRASSPSPARSDQFLARLSTLRSDAADGRVPMREVFALAKQSMTMPPVEIEGLLDRPEQDARVGAVSIMDFQARSSRTAATRRRELYELYLRRHDRIDTWDMVDRAAPYVVGGYLFDRSREPLHRLARSQRWYERRTAIVATYFFIRKDDLDETFAIGDLLAEDPHELVQKAVGGWVREAGKRDQARLLGYLDRHAATMPRTALRFAVEHLDPDLRRHYLELAKA